MGFRFRKSVRLCKGVRLNFSNSGVSATIGGRGASVNVGKRGVYQNFSIPGTGISYRTKLAGGSSAPRNAQRAVSSGGVASPRVPAAVRQWQEYTGRENPSASFSVDEYGEILFHDECGNLITDQCLISIISKTPAFRERKAKLQRLRQNAGAATVEQDRERMREVLDVYKSSPVVSDRSVFESRLVGLSPKEYELLPFSEAAPDLGQLQYEVSREADAAISTLAFWKRRRMKNEYFNSHIEQRYYERKQAWEYRKNKFEREQIERKRQLDRRYYDEYLAEKRKVERALSGDSSYIEDEVAHWFEACVLPLSIDAQYEYRGDCRTLLVDLDLPEIEDLPQEKLVQLKSGIVKSKAKTQKELRNEYVQCVFGFCVLVLTSLLSISPAINSMVLSAYTQRPDKNGDIVDDYIVSMRVPRDRMCGLRVADFDPKELCLGFEARCKMTQTGIFKTIVPFDA